MTEKKNIPSENPLPNGPQQPIGYGTVRTECTTQQTQAPQTLYDEIRARSPEMRIGQVVRSVREASDLDLKMIAEELRIGARYLMDIERMELSGLPKGYLTKYLGAYATRLGLSRATIVEDYTADCHAVDTVAAPQVVQTPDLQSTPIWRHPAIAAAAVLSLVCTGALVVFSGSPDQDEESLRAMTASVNGARESLFANAPLPTRLEVASLELSLVAVAEGWIEVRGADGTVFRSRVMQAGEVYMPRLGAGWTVSARNGSAFEWRVGDAIIGPLSEEPTPVYAASVDAAAARAADIATPALAAAGGGQVSR